jgi:hypothetical protein
MFERARRVLATTLAVTVWAGAAGASVIWDGNASLGTGVFKATGTGNCVGEGSSQITAVSDGTYGTVWRYHKPTDSNRCENHGVKQGGSNVVFNEGSTYYFGWRYKVTTAANNNANFQWKSYGTGHQQNFPVVIKNVDGEVKLMHTAPGGASTYIWSAPFSANTWNTVVLALYLHSSDTSGWIEFWWNGTKQTLLGGSQRYYGRTWDVGDHNCPKWGVYGGMGTDMSNYAHALKAGTTYADAAPSGGGGSPTPTPTPTPSGGGSFSGYYRLMGQASGRALVVQSASTANNASVVVYDYNDNATDNDEWEIRSIGSGYHRIIGRQSGKDMTVASASTANGANIIQYTYGGTATNDEWQLVDSGSGYYEIRNRNSGKNVQAMGTANGSAVQQHTDDGGTDQRFQPVSIP